MISGKDRQKRRSPINSAVRRSMGNSIGQHLIETDKEKEKRAAEKESILNGIVKPTAKNVAHKGTLRN